MNDDSKEFQKELARIQIWSNTSVSVGGVSFGIGATMWITAFSLIGTASTLQEEAPFLLDLVTLFNKLGPLFSIAGITFILMGFILPIILLRSKSQKNVLDANKCYCGNKIPCTIHENKSSPI